MDNTILCVKWGDKYGREYVEKLKEQCEDNCSVPFNFYCLTDKPTESYDILLPTDWDEYEGKHSRYRNKQAPSNMWAYRKLYMFKLDEVGPGGGAWNRADVEWKKIQGNKFLYLDLDVIIHQDLKFFFDDLHMDRPYIVRGWWNDLNECHKNYAAMKSTPINSSVVRWNRGQLVEVYDHIRRNLDVLFFTYPTIDNYLNHFWYHMWDEDLPQDELLKRQFFRPFERGLIYSYYKGSGIFADRTASLGQCLDEHEPWPEDMEPKKIRLDHKICLFNNSAETNDIEELKSLW